MATMLSLETQRALAIISHVDHGKSTLPTVSSS